MFPLRNKVWQHNPSLILSGIIFLSLLTTCRKEEKTKLSGESVISTKLYGTGPYYTYGFSFSTGKNYPYPGTSSVRIDLVAQALTDPQGNLTGVVLASPDNDKAFYTNGTFGDSSSALAFFSSYTEAETTTFSPLSDTIVANQVLTYRSVVPTYAKILIPSVRFWPDNLTGQYAEIAFRWVYQPDGSPLFP